MGRGHIICMVFACVWLPQSSNSLIVQHSLSLRNFRLSLACEKLSCVPPLSRPKNVRGSWTPSLGIVATAAERGSKQTVATETRAEVWGHTWYPLQFEKLADKVLSCSIYEMLTLDKAIGHDFR